MKVRKNLILRKMGDTWAVFPIAEQLGYYGNIMRLNETGAFLWKCLCKEVTKDEFEAVAYLCGGSSSNSNSNGKYYPDGLFHPNKPGHHKGC